MDDSKRLFIGFPLGVDISGTIDMLKTTINFPECVRWTFGRKLHLTLIYIGQLNSAKTELLIDKFNSIDFIAPFEMSLEFTGTFPDEGPPRVFWLGVKDGKNEVTLLHKTTSALLNECGILFDTRKFKPHLTLGWAKRNKKAEKIDSEMFLNAVFSPVRFRVKSVHLYSSELLPEGAKYTSLAEVKLK